jgi:putative oxidoreductase
MGNQPVSGLSAGMPIGLGREHALTAVIVLAGRILFSLIFVTAGPTLLLPPAAQIAMQHGVPLAHILVPIAGVIATLGGLSVLLGYHAKIGAWLIVIFLVVVTPTMHNFWAVADPMVAKDQMAHFMKNLSMLGGALLLTQFGAGPWSLDARRK